MQAPVLVLNANAKRESGRKAQFGNIAAAKSVSDVIRTTLGPRSMLKMILDPMGGIIMTNDGNAIVREIDVSHPAAKAMIELARTQDEEVGDGTTSVIILTGELLVLAQPLLQRSMHPRVIVGAFIKAMDFAIATMNDMALTLDVNNRHHMLNLVRSCLGTKFVSRFGDLIANLSLDAVMTVTVDRGPQRPKEIDIKRYARVEKIPGGFLEDSVVLRGVMLNKDVVHPAMRRRIVSPRILLLDCNLEFKKAESQTNIELKKEEDFEAVLKMEEEYIHTVCKSLIALKPDLICTEKGVSDLAAHYLQKANITVLRRVRKTDNNRIARASGATICSVADEVKESDIGKGCGLFEVNKIGDEYFSYIVDCADPKACSIVLRGASKDVLNEIERNLMDAMSVVRNIALDPRIVPGGGAVEMAVAHAIATHSKTLSGVAQWPFKAVANALEIIPKTLIENCGASPIKLLTQLRAKHAQSQSQSAVPVVPVPVPVPVAAIKSVSSGDGVVSGVSIVGRPGMCTWGIDGNAGVVVDMLTLQIFEPFAVKSQTIKTAIEAAAMLLRIDDIVSGMSGRGGGGGGGGAGAGGAPPSEGQDEETFGDGRDG